MRSNSKDKVLIDHYNKFKKRIQLEYEIDLLETSTRQLERYLDGKLEINIRERIKYNKELLAKKNLEHNMLVEDTVKIESIILGLDEEDKEICEMRFKKHREYQAIGYSLCLSKSTVCRKVNSIVDKINKELQ